MVFTEHGVTMLASVLRSDTAINISIQIVRAFVAMPSLTINAPINEVGELQREVREFKQYIEEVFADYNDINDDTHMQLELINGVLAELQAKDRVINKPRMAIGYVK